MSELDRVRWHCRRGMLELDLLLHRFLDRHLASLTPDEMERFKEVLDLRTATSGSSCRVARRSRIDASNRSS